MANDDLKITVDLTDPPTCPFVASAMEKFREHNVRRHTNHNAMTNLLSAMAMVILDWGNVDDASKLMTLTQQARKARALVDDAYRLARALEADDGGGY